MSKQLCKLPLAQWCFAEEIGANILGNLHTQRETIVRIGDRVENVDSNVGRARGILNTMARR